MLFLFQKKKLRKFFWQPLEGFTKLKVISKLLLSRLNLQEVCALARLKVSIKEELEESRIKIAIFFMRLTKISLFMKLIWVLKWLKKRVNNRKVNKIQIFFRQLTKWEDKS